MNRSPVNPHPDSFCDLMRPGERIAALIYLPIHLFALPLLLPYLTLVTPELDSLGINLIYYITGFAYTLILCWRFLKAGFNAALDSLGRFFLSIVAAYALEVVLSTVLSLLLMIFGLESLYSPNNDAIVSMVPEGYNLLFAMTVFMAPFVEEVLFRGLIFGSIRRKSRAAAWIISVLAFSLYHVWQYAFINPLYLVSAVLYVPASLAFNWCYERSGSIWAPILYHMLSNAIGMSVL